MSDDTTTTWLKKSTEIHPLKRSLKTSMRLQVNSAEMDGSIISNLDKPAQIFIPRMMQRPSMRMMKLRTSGLLSEIATAKTLSKPKVSEINNKGVNVKAKAADPVIPKKSFVPIRRNQPVNSGKKQELKIMMRPRLLPQGSMRKNARKELIEKMVKLDEESQRASTIKTSEKKLSPHSTGDNSVLRSILKKHRASLRRASQISGEKKPKAAKKVIFEGFQMQNGENKENEKNLSLDDETNVDFAVLEEPTVFLNFPNKFESTPASDKTNKGKQQCEVLPSESLKNILNILSDYQAKVKYLKSAENSISSSLESVIQSSRKLKEEFESYKKISEEMHVELSRLDEEVNEKLSRILSGAEGRKSPRTSLGSVGSETKNKIRLSDKSKNIRKNSAKKPGPAIKKRFWITPEENYTLVEKENVLSNFRMCQ